MDDGAFHAWTGIRDGSIISLYRDGILIDSGGSASGSITLNRCTIGALGRTSVTLNIDDTIRCFYKYSRMLTPTQIEFLSDYPLAPFILRDPTTYLGYSGSVITAPAQKNAVITTPNIIIPRPSLREGYARNAAESAFPELWDSLIGAWIPALGYQGNVLHDFSGRGKPGIMTGTSVIPGNGGLGLLTPANQTTAPGAIGITLTQADGFTVAASYSSVGGFILSNFGILMNVKGVAENNIPCYFLLEGGTPGVWFWHRRGATLPADWNDDKSHGVAGVHPPGGDGIDEMFYYDGRNIGNALASSNTYTNTGDNMTIGYVNPTVDFEFTPGLIYSVLLWQRELGDADARLVTAYPLAPFIQHDLLNELGLEGSAAAIAALFRRIMMMRAGSRGELIY